MWGAGVRWRVEESQEQVTLLRDDMNRWFGKWRTEDRVRAHASQLKALRTSIETVLGKIADGLPRSGSDMAVGEIYDNCRENDKRTAHVLRLWRFFADKFDQRFDPAEAAALAAADEIGWSCFAAAAGYQGWTAAAPLAYFDARYAPTAFTREETPADLRPADALLRQHVRLLPIPLIALPRVCVDRPWWLILLAHEVGHQVQHAIGGGLTEAFADAIGDLADDAKAARGLWRGWSQELFADAFGVLTAGGWVAWAVSELERTTPEGMLLSADNRYPPPLVRAGFMAGVAAASGWAEGPEPPGAGSGQADWAAAAAIAARVIDQPLGAADGPTLTGLAGLPQPGPDRLTVTATWERRVKGFRKVLLSEDPLEADTKHLEAARLCAAGATAAWHGLLNGEDTTKAAITRLRDRSRNAISRCQVEGTRGTPSSPSSVKQASDALATSLFAADPLALGVG